MSDALKQILEYNKEFVKNKKYEEYATTKYPNKKIAILTCMDTRLTELLPDALNIKNGDVKLIKNAGGVVNHPFGSVTRSLMVAIYELGVTEILVIGHYDCGMQGLDSSEIIHKMTEHGISEETIKMVKSCGIELEKWLHGFDDVETSVHETVKSIKEHPLIPKDVSVYGLIMDPVTGELTQLD